MKQTILLVEDNPDEVRELNTSGLAQINRI